MRVTVFVLGIFLLVTPMQVLAQSKAQKPPPVPSQPGSASCQPPAASPAEVQALQADLKRMRSLLAQMQTNLAFVQNAPTPLKHQFELEIDMWSTLLDHIERHMGTVTPESSGSQRP